MIHIPALWISYTRLSFLFWKDHKLDTGFLISTVYMYDGFKFIFRCVTCVTSVGVAVGDGSDRRCGRRGDAAVRLSAAAHSAAARLDLHPHPWASGTPVCTCHRPRPLIEDQFCPPGHPPLLFTIIITLQLSQWQLSHWGTCCPHAGGEGAGGAREGGGWGEEQREGGRGVFFPEEHGGQTEVSERHRENSSGPTTGHHWIHQTVSTEVLLQYY